MLFLSESHSQEYLAQHRIAPIASLVLWMNSFSRRPLLNLLQWTRMVYIFSLYDFSIISWSCSFSLCYSLRFFFRDSPGKWNKATKVQLLIKSIIYLTILIHTIPHYIKNVICSLLEDNRVFYSLAYESVLLCYHILPLLFSALRIFLHCHYVTLLSFVPFLPCSLFSSLLFICSSLSLPFIIQGSSCLFS